MWNKLLRHRRHILTPLLSDLKELSTRTAADPVRLSGLNHQIAELTEQNPILSQVYSKGFLDSVIFTQQADELSGKINSLRTERRNLLKQDEDDPVLTGIQTLADIIDEAKPLTEFDESAFISVAEDVIIDSDKKLRFRLKGGLELLEFPGEMGT